MLMEVAGSLLGVVGAQTLVRATSVELMLPVNVKVNRSREGLIFCADVPCWRWRTDWDPPFGQLRVLLEETRLECNT
jgi:hypothetical protein